jgi:hypothetical protein
LIRGAERIDDLESERAQLVAELEQLEEEQRTLDLRDPHATDAFERRIAALRCRIARLRSP